MVAITTLRHVDRKSEPSRALTHWKSWHTLPYSEGKPKPPMRPCEFSPLLSGAPSLTHVASLLSQEPLSTGPPQGLCMCQALPWDMAAQIVSHPLPVTLTHHLSAMPSWLHGSSPPHQSSPSQPFPACFTFPGTCQILSAPHWLLCKVSFVLEDPYTSLENKSLGSEFRAESSAGHWVSGGREG